MGLVQAFAGAISGTFADQWREVITAGSFDEQTVVAPGIYQVMNRGRGTNYKGSVDVISNGSRILVPENTAAFVFSQAGIQDIVTQPGGFEFRAGQPSVFSGYGFTSSLIRQPAQRIAFGGQAPDKHYVAFVNLREMRGLKFGTRGPMIYHDRFYNADLELQAFGTFSLRVVDPVAFVRGFLPPNVREYSFASPAARQQITGEFIQAFISAVNALSATHKISELPSQAGNIAAHIAHDQSQLGAWIKRFGLDVVQVGIENIQLTDASRELVKQFASNRMNVSAYEGVSRQASDSAAQQRIAKGVETHGFGDGAGMLFGMNLAQTMNPTNVAAAGYAPSAPAPQLTFDQQVDAVKKLKDLLDAGILSADEFEAKKKQILGL